MTTEIAVMNRRAIVLAADSAVTVTHWENGQKEERYFKGANKIFQLSDTQPLGLMIFDAADLQRVPWEIIVKEFRSRLCGNRCGTVQDYAIKFFTFIEGHAGLFPSEYRHEILRENVEHVMFRHILLADEDDEVKAKIPGSDEAAVTRAGVLSNILAYLNAQPPVDPLTVSDLRNAEESHRSTVLLTAKEFLTLTGLANHFPAEDLVTIGFRALFAFPNMFLTNTGIVVGGYGDDDYFPSYEEFACSGFVGDKLI